MSRLIPNENTWIGFAVVTPPNLAAPSASALAAAIELTDFVVSLTASSTGNTVPTPSLKTLFETSIPGTSAAQFSVDFYRDNADDKAWDLLPRGTEGVFYISRFGGTGANGLPVPGDKIETWPVQVTSRSASPLSSNTAQMFTLTASVPREPAEDAIVAA